MCFCKMKFVMRWWIDALVLSISVDVEWWRQSQSFKSGCESVKVQSLIEGLNCWLQLLTFQSSVIKYATVGRYF